jgi:hypothetical protein
MIFQNIVKKVELTSDQLYAVGFGDGLADRPMDRNYRESIDYLLGYGMGGRSTPTTTVVDSPLETEFLSSL